MHHALNRMIPRADVVVPFAEHISEQYPVGNVEARRSYRHVLQVVKASALLHFRQRDRDAAGRVVATVADYAVAERLARMTPAGHEAVIHVTLTDDHPWAQAFVVIEARPRGALRG